MHGGDATVGCKARSHPHEHRVASPVGVEDLLPAEVDADRSPGEDRQFRCDELVGERFGLPTEPTPIRRCHHPDTTGGELQHPLEGAVQVVGNLGGRPQRELPGSIVRGQNAVGLQCCVGVPAVVEHVLTDMVGDTESLIDVTELERHRPVDVPAGSLTMDERAVL